MTKQLEARIRSGEARAGVVGLGYVGLPLAHALHGGGLPVIGFDIDPAKPKAIKEGKNYLQHLGDSMITDLRDSKRFEATTDFGRLGECDVIIVAVPTPLGRHHEPDISYIINTGVAMAPHLQRGTLVVVTLNSGSTNGPTALSAFDMR